MITYLNVPFRDKAEVKARGARWDGAARKWFVPTGRDLEPFTSWLPVDPAKLAQWELTDTVHRGFDEFWADTKADLGIGYLGQDKKVRYY